MLPSSCIRYLSNNVRNSRVVSSLAEFETIPIRRHEDILLRRIYKRVPVKLDRADFEAPHFKTFLLLQAHFSQIQLPPDLAAYRVLVLEICCPHVST
jgi:pre-mRNA-splicing helicase BRR2